MSGIHQMLLAGGGKQPLIIGDVTIGVYLTQWYGYATGSAGSWSEAFNSTGKTVTYAVSRNTLQEAWFVANEPILTTSEGATTPTIDVSNRGVIITMAPAWSYDSDLLVWSWLGYYNYAVGSTDPWGWAAKSGQTETITVFATV